MMSMRYKSCVNFALSSLRVSRRRHLTLGTLLVVLVAAALVALPAQARLNPLAGGGSGNLYLVASAPSSVDVQGKVVTWGNLVTPGRLEVQGRAGTFNVRLNGVLQKPRRGVVRLENVAGRFAVQGTVGIRVRVEGASFEMSVAGRGTALPAGTGTASLNGATPTAWTGQPIVIAPPIRVKKQIKRPQPPARGTTTAGNAP